MTDDWDWEDDSDELTAEEIADMDRRMAELEARRRELYKSPEVRARAAQWKKIEKLQEQYAALFGEEVYLGLFSFASGEEVIELLERCIREKKPVKYPPHALPEYC